MKGIIRANIFGELSLLCFAAIHSATAFCKQRGSAYVELLYWPLQLDGLAQSNCGQILSSFGIYLGTLARDLTRALCPLRPGASTIPDPTSKVTPQAWLIAKVAFSNDRIRSGGHADRHVACGALPAHLRGVSRRAARSGRSTSGLQPRPFKTFRRPRSRPGEHHHGPS